MTPGAVPPEVWSEKKPDVSHLKVFGCMVYAHVADAQRQKLNKHHSFVKPSFPIVHYLAHVRV